MIVADDNAAFLKRLTAILGMEFDVIASARDGMAALDLIRRHKPDVAVLDLSMPGLNGIQVAKEATQVSPAPRVVICSIETDAEIIEAAQQAGALGYVFKPRIEKELLLAVKTATAGRFYASSTARNTDDIALCQLLI